jgi:4-hydroxy-tetrahydrodipicolinate synthase
VGTTGEISTLDYNEHVEVAAAAVEIVKAHERRVPVIAGSGGNDTRHTKRLAADLEKHGVDAVMLVTPYYNKTSQKGLIEHFCAVAGNIHIPVVLYNVPSRTGLNILPATAHTLSKVENIAAIKEASGNITQVAEVFELCGGALDVYSGDDAMVVPIMSLGGKGVISTVSNIAPQQTHDMVYHYINGNVKAAAEMQLEMLGLIRALFKDVNPMPVKAALNLMGFDAGPCRMPLTTIDNSLREELINQMKGYGLL